MRCHFVKLRNWGDVISLNKVECVNTIRINRCIEIYTDNEIYKKRLLNVNRSINNSIISNLILQIDKIF